MAEGKTYPMVSAKTARQWNKTAQAAKANFGRADSKEEVKTNKTEVTTPVEEVVAVPKNKYRKGKAKKEA